MVNETEKSMRVDSTFNDLIWEYINEYEKKHKIRISTKDATKVLADRILKAGGFIV